MDPKRASQPSSRGKAQLISQGSETTARLSERKGKPVQNISNTPFSNGNSPHFPHLASFHQPQHRPLPRISAIPIHPPPAPRPPPPSPYAAAMDPHPTPFRGKNPAPSHSLQDPTPAYQFRGPILFTAKRRPAAAPAKSAAPPKPKTVATARGKTVAKKSSPAGVSAPAAPQPR
jgi:hypothetical protein